MTQINQNLNNIFIKKPLKPSFKADNAVQYQPEQIPEYYEESAQYQDYYYPEDYYSEDSLGSQADSYEFSQDIYNMAYDKNGKPVLPSIYENADKKEPKSIIEFLKDEPTKMISTWFTNPLLMLGTCGLLSYGVDSFNKGCSGEYERTLLGKATGWGDRLEQSKFAQSKPVQKTVSAIKKGWEKTWEFLNKSDLIRSMTKTPSKPEWDTAKYDILPQEVRILEDFNTIADGLKLSNTEPIRLKDVGPSREERKMIKKLFNVNSLSKVPEEASVGSVLLKRLGKTETEIATIVAGGDSANIAKAEILKALELTVEDLEKIKLKPEEYIDKVKEACKKVGGKVKVKRGYHEILGGIQPLASEVSCDQIANKLRSLHIGDGVKTGTGKFMSQLIQKIHRGFTFGGGKLSIFFFIAPWLVMAMKNTKKADPDQKVGTAAYGLVESISWVFTFPLAIKSIYALGGMKYAGMSEDSVTKFRDLLDKFNKNVDAKAFANEASYNAAKDELKQQMKLLKNGMSFEDVTKYITLQNEFNAKSFTDKASKKAAKAELEKQLKALRNNSAPEISLFTKIMKKIQSGLQLDLEMIKPFQDGNRVKDFIKRIPNNARNWVGVPLRIIITGFVIESAYRELLMKGVKAVFGKNYDEMKEEEHEAAKKAQKEFTIKDLRERMLEIQAAKLTGTLPQEKAEAFALPEDIGKTLAYEKRREAIEEAQKKQSGRMNIEENMAVSKNLLEQNKQEQKVEQKIEQKEESVVEEINSQKVAQEEQSSVSSNMIDDYVQKTGNNSQNEVVNEEKLGEKPYEKIYKEEVVKEQKIEERKQEENIQKPNQYKKAQETPVSNPMTSDLIAAATAGGAVGVVNNAKQEKIAHDNYNYMPSQAPSKDVLAQKQEVKKRDNYTYIPSEKNVIKEQADKENVNKYIPSQRAANISKTFDNSGLDEALARADRAEQNALKILAGNFDGMV